MAGGASSGLGLPSGLIRWSAGRVNVFLCASSHDEGCNDSAKSGPAEDRSWPRLALQYYVRAHEYEHQCDRKCEDLAKPAFGELSANAFDICIQAFFLKAPPVLPLDLRCLKNL